MTRKYTVYEIDGLRQAVQNKYLYGSYNPSFAGNGGMSRSYQESEMTKVVEEQVRTHMLAGHTYEDLVPPRAVEQFLEGSKK